MPKRSVSRKRGRSRSKYASSKVDKLGRAKFATKKIRRRTKGNMDPFSGRTR